MQTRPHTGAADRTAGVGAFVSSFERHFREGGINEPLFAQEYVPAGTAFPNDVVNVIVSLAAVGSPPTTSNPRLHMTVHPVFRSKVSPAVHGTEFDADTNARYPDGRVAGRVHWLGLHRIVGGTMTLLARQT